MKNKLITLFVLITCLAFTSNMAVAADTGSLMADGQAKYAAYNEDLGNIQKSIEIFEEVVKQDKNNLPAIIMLARAWIVYGDIVQKNNADKDKAYEKAKIWAAKGLTINNKSAQAHLWYFVAFGKILQHRDMFTAMGSFNELKSHIVTAYNLNPNDTVIAGAYGVFYREIPDIMGRDIKKSEELLRKSIALNPNYARGYRELAQTLYEEGKKAEARSMAEKTINLISPSDTAAWAMIDKPKAQELLREMK